jgi:hypothetical protein
MITKNFEGQWDFLSDDISRNLVEMRLDAGKFNELAGRYKMLMLRYLKSANEMGVASGLAEEINTLMEEGLASLKDISTNFKKPEDRSSAVHEEVVTRRLEYNLEYLEGNLKKFGALLSKSSIHSLNSSSDNCIRL